MKRRVTHSRLSIQSLMLSASIAGLVGCGSTESPPGTGGAGGLGGSGGGSAACATACGVGQTCSGGACVCSAGLSSCPGVVNACFDLTSDGTHCGSCTVACPTGQVCSQGKCGTTCPTGSTACGSSCANLTSDSANCGSCGRICTGGQTCQNSACVGGSTGGTGGGGTGTGGSVTGGVGPGTGGSGPGTGGGVTGGVGPGTGGGVTGGVGPGTGGRTGRGGMGGNTGVGGGLTGGVGPTGGGGGASPTGGTTGAGGGPTGPCSDEFFTTNSATQSTTISTVFTVDWSATGAVESAYIDFGRDANAYEYRATIDKPAQSGNKTMLLGMKPDKTYSYQIVVTSGGTTHASCAKQVTTGSKRSGMPAFKVTTANAAAVSPGFNIGCFFGMGGGMGGGGSTWAYILDKDGEYVWWYQTSTGSDCVRTRMSYDGQYMWMANGNVPGPSSGTLLRVRMDGTNEKTFSLPNRHHDISILPDETVVFIEYAGGNSNGCDTVKELTPESGATKTVLDVASTGGGG